MSKNIITTRTDNNSVVADISTVPVEISINDENWVELINISTKHFSHAKSSATITKEMDFLKTYSEEVI